MESLKINHHIYNLIITSSLYRNFILRIYIINKSEYIDHKNLEELMQLFNTCHCKIKLDNIKIIEEVVLFNNQSYNLINKYILLKFIKSQNYEILYNTIVFLIEHIKEIKLYPDYTYEIKKFENEIKKLKIQIINLQKITNDVDDLKHIMNYINNKINKTYENTNIYSENNTDSLINTYNFYFPNLYNS
jgi:hypothetical protein